MLKRIPIDHLTLGMHLHALCGRWIDHPFWKAKFVLSDPADLAALRGSGVVDCWIDSAKGLDVAAPAADAAIVLPAPAPGSPPAGAPVAPVSTPGADAVAAPRSPHPTTSMADELVRCAAIVAASREAVLAVFEQARLGEAIDATRCLPLVADIAGSVARNRDALVSLTRLKAQDAYTYLHSVAVCALMVALAQELGHGEAAVREAGLAGLLHDVGKAVIPAAILAKPGRLTDAEYELIKTHPRRGHELLVGSSLMSAGVLDVCLHHHERPDGKGYPDRLGHEQISLIARMGAVCDVYDAVTSDRPYKQRWDPAEALARMADWTRGGQFDPAIFAAFLQSLGVYPTGSLVRLRSGRLAVVVEQNPGDFRRPKLKCFYSTKAAMPIPIELLDTADRRCSDAIVARESNDSWRFGQIDELWAGRELLTRLTRAG